jgi:hypothetical protein
MSPLAGAAEPVIEGLSRIDIDRQLPVNGHASLQKLQDRLSDQSSASTFGSSSSGDLSGTSDRRSGLTEPAQQLVNIPNNSLQQQNRSQKQSHFSRFVPSQDPAPVNHLLANQYPNSTPSTIPPSTFSHTNYPSSRHPNHQARVPSRPWSFVFREQSGVYPSTSGEQDSYRSSLLRPNAGSAPHSTLHPPDTISPWDRPPPPFGHNSSEEYNTFRFSTDRR